MIQQLKNPCTQNYQQLQNIIFEPDMTWNYHDPMSFPGENREKELPYYSHMIMSRPMPGKSYSSVTSPLFDLSYKVIEEILQANNIQLNTIYRINLNSTFDGELKQSSWHKDLSFPHFNLLVYMSMFEGGATMVRYKDDQKSFEPKPNDAIIFDGTLEHCHLTPTSGRRITLVVNYL